MPSGTPREALQAALGSAFRLDREIGGGMSRVFLADEVALGRKVVVKLLAADVAGGLSEERFAREVQIAARLQDPHIVPLLSSGFAGGVPWYTMPFVEGESLRHRMDAGPPLDTQASLRILRDVAVALEYAHGKGVVHRDIKPENVLLSARTAMVTDFGIAMAMDAARTTAGGEQAARLTDVGVTVGTPAYMAPEQAAGDAVDQRADLYAWAVIAYELLAGAHPFGERKTARELVTAHLTQTPARLSARVQLDDAVADIVARCLAKNPAERPASATEVIAALDAATGTMMHGSVGRRTPYRRRALRYSGAALGLIVLAWGAMEALGTTGIGPFGTLLAAGTFTAKDQLLVADFRVAGADSSLGSVVAEAVRADMAQSRVATIVPASAISAALQRMKKPAGSTLDSALAHVMAQREGIKGVITGDVKPLGNGYIVTMRLTNAGGDELTSSRATADGPKDLIGVIDELSRKLRSKIGESLLAVRATPPLGKVTTESLDALRLYSAGVRANSVLNDFDESAALFRRAIAIDSTFAMAYVRLASALQNGRRSPESADSALENAYRLRAHLPEHERLVTMANYYVNRNDRRRAVDVLLQAIERDSLDANALNLLATQYRFLREFAKAESTSRRAMRADSTITFNYAAVIMAQIDQGHVAEAVKTADALEKQGSFPRMARMRFLLASAQLQLDSVEAPLTRMSEGKEPVAQIEGTRGLAALAAAFGRAAEADRLFAKAAALSGERRNPAPFEAVLDSAQLDIWVRSKPERAVRMLDAALAATPIRSMTERQLAATLEIISLMATANRPDRAKAVLAQWEMRADTAVKRMNLAAYTVARGEIALADGQPKDAVLRFRAADQQPEGALASCIVICTSQRLARAFDKAQMPDSAVLYYEQYVTMPYHLRLFEDAWHLAASHERLAQLYANRGDRAKAQEHHARFVQLWTKADPELQPRVAAARKQLAQ